MRSSQKRNLPFLIRNPMVKRALRAIIYYCLVFLGVSILTFALGRLAPGDPAETYTAKGDGIVTEADLEAAREKLGLNNPLPQQYAEWLAGLTKGDFGISYDSGKPVLDEILLRMPVTIRLTLASLILALAISLPLAWLCAVHNGKVADHIMRVVNTVLMAIPTFCIGLMLMLLLGVKLKWLPIVSGNGWKRYALPVLTLAIGMSSGMIRFFRTQFLEAMCSEHVIYARQMGVSEIVIFFHHILSNIAFQLLTYIGLRLGGMLGGSYIVENMFALQGAGNLLVSSVSARDYPMIQGYAILMAVICVGIRVLTELIGALGDPRIRRGQEVAK